MYKLFHTYNAETTYGSKDLHLKGYDFIFDFAHGFHFYTTISMNILSYIYVYIIQYALLYQLYLIS